MIHNMLVVLLVSFFYITSSLSMEKQTERSPSYTSIVCTDEDNQTTLDDTVDHVLATITGATMSTCQIKKQKPTLLISTQSGAHKSFRSIDEIPALEKHIETVIIETKAFYCISLHNKGLCTLDGLEKIARLVPNPNRVLAIFLSGNNLSSIDKKLFTLFPKAEEICLSHNNITSIEKDAFQANKYAKRIDLSGNPLSAETIKMLRSFKNNKHIELVHAKLLHDDKSNN